MKTFMLRLLGATQCEDIAEVISFVGEDDTGSFGLLADHARFMTMLSMGIAKYRIGENQWQYLAAPGGVVYFHDNVLTVCTDRYLLDDDYRRINKALQQQLLAEEETIQAFKDSLQHMEEEVFKRLWEMGRSEMI